jgi:hypothetical protein
LGQVRSAKRAVIKDNSVLGSCYKEVKINEVVILLFPVPTIPQMSSLPRS